MLEYQKQNCQLTLREGLKCYYQSFPKSKEILKDSPESGYLLRDHDCTHVIFGNGITFEEESINDLHGLILCSYKWKDYLAYFDDPFLKNLMKFLWKEVGLKKTIISMFNIYKSIFGILKMRFKMKKKWPLKVPDSYLDRKICDLREEYGIKILSESQRPRKFIEWSGAIKNPK